MKTIITIREWNDYMTVRIERYGHDETLTMRAENDYDTPKWTPIAAVLDLDPTLGECT